MDDTFNAGQLAVLERLAAGAPLPRLLEDIVRFIERQSTGMVCSILLLAPKIPADATQLHQIVMNLALNASYALGSRGGTIEVSLESFVEGADSPTPRVELTEGRYLRLSVADNGCGMDEATLKRVFDPFFTTKPSGD